MYRSITHHLYSVLCVHHPKSRLFWLWMEIYIWPSQGIAFFVSPCMKFQRVVLESWQDWGRVGESWGILHILWPWAYIPALFSRGMFLLHSCSNSGPNKWPCSGVLSEGETNKQNQRVEEPWFVMLAEFLPPPPIGRFPAITVSQPTCKHPCYLTIGSHVGGSLLAPA